MALFLTQQDRNLGLQLSDRELEPLKLLAGKYGNIFGSYVHNYDEVINQGLRNNQVSPFIQRKVKQIIDAIDEINPISKDYVLYQGTSGRNYVVGQSYIDPGFQSKTVDIASFDDCCLLRIRYPAGTRQIPIYSNEKEVLTYPNEEIYIEREEIIDQTIVYQARFIRYVPFTLTANIPDIQDTIIEKLYPSASNGIIISSNGQEQRLAIVREFPFNWKYKIRTSEVYDRLYLMIYDGKTDILVVDSDLLGNTVEIQFRNGRSITFSKEDISYLVFELYMDPSPKTYSLFIPRVQER